MLAVGYRRLGSVAVLQMPRGRVSTVHFALPKQLAGLPVDAIDHPAMLVARRRFAVAAEVQALLGSLFRLCGNHRGQKNAVARDHR
jgi:hypothetical protein